MAGGRPRRSLRAYEVIIATGKPLSEWHKQGAPPLFTPDEALRVVLVPERCGAL